MNALKKTMLAIISGAICIAANQAHALLTITNLFDDFGPNGPSPTPDLSNWAPSPPTGPDFIGQVDGGTITVATPTNSGPLSTSLSTIRTTAFASPVNVGEAVEFDIDVTYLYTTTIQGANIPQFLLQQTPTSSTVSNHLSQIVVTPRLSGTFQLQVRRFVDTVGNQELIVDESISQTFGTSYFTLNVNRTEGGLWSVTRSDTATTFLTAQESIVASGSALNTFDIKGRDFKVNFDSISVTSTIPEPATMTLFSLAGIGVLRMRRQKT